MIIFVGIAMVTINKCDFLFECIGTKLAYAYFPEDDGCREIHCHVDDYWYYGLDSNL